MASLQLDNRVSFFFEKLFIPGLEIPEFEIEITYKEKKSRLKYPMKEPLILVLDNCFTNDNKIEILVLQRESATRLKKIAKGNINIYKKYFNFTKKYKEEKWVYLDLFNAKGTVGDQNTVILQTVSSTGKIFMKVALLNPPPEEEISGPGKLHDGHTVVTTKTSASVYSQALKNNLKTLDKTKENIKANKTEKFRSISENTNEYLRNLKNRKIGADEYIIEEVEEPAKPDPEPNDGLSDVEESVIDGNEDDLHLELGRINPEVDLIVAKLREVFATKGDELIPTNKEEITLFIKNVHNQIENLGHNYSLNINTINEINKKIKFQAKNYYEKYKEIKASFEKERRELRSKNTILDYEVSLNNEENARLRQLYDDVKNELLFFRQKVGIKLEQDPIKDDDFLSLVSLIKEVSNDVDTGGLEEQEKYNLNGILEYYQITPSSIKNVESYPRSSSPTFNNNYQNVYEENAGVSVQAVKNETVHFSDNDDEDDILRNNSHREDTNNIVQESVLNYNKTNKPKENVKFTHLKDDDYDFNGIQTKLSVVDGQVLVLDRNNNWVSLNEFLSSNFPTTKSPYSTSSSKKNKAVSSQSNAKNVTSSSIQSQLEKIKEEKQKLLSSMSSNSQTTITRSKTPTLSNTKKIAS